MSRPPDEYFASPGPVPDEPPAGYFDDRPPELDALIDAVAAAVDETAMPRRCPDDGACHHDCVGTCFRVECCGPLSGVYPNDEWPSWVIVDEMSMACGRQNGKQTALDEILRLGRIAGLAPLYPLPPKWFGSRLRYDIPSVPALEVYRDQCSAWLARAPGGWPWMTAYRALVEAEQALDDARWRLACESYRWVRDYPNITDEQAWWSLMTMIAARRSEVLAEAGTCWSGKELAVREVAG